MKYRDKMIEQLKMCFLNKFKKKSVYVCITFHFNKININVFSEHLKIFSAFEKFF